MKTPEFVCASLLLIVGLAGCGKPFASASPHSAVVDDFTPVKITTVTQAQGVLNSEQLTPSADAPFGKDYGSYKIISCIDKSKNNPDLEVCEYADVLIYTNKASSSDNTTTVSLSRRQGTGVEFATFLFQPPTNPSLGKYVEHAQSASLTTDISGYKTEASSETTIEEISHTRYKLTLKNKSWMDVPAAHNFDYDFELVLEKQSER